MEVLNCTETKLHGVTTPSFQRIWIWSLSKSSLSVADLVHAFFFGVNKQVAEFLLQNLFLSVVDRLPSIYDVSVSNCVKIAVSYVSAVVDASCAS